MPPGAVHIYAPVDEHNRKPIDKIKDQMYIYIVIPICVLYIRVYFIFDSEWSVKFVLSLNDIYNIVQD